MVVFKKKLLRKIFGHRRKEGRKEHEAGDNCIVRRFRILS
jgi:hypothetical protein